MDASFLNGKKPDSTVDRASMTPSLAGKSASTAKDQPARSKNEPSQFEQMVRQEPSSPAPKKKTQESTSPERSAQPERSTSPERPESREAKSTGEKPVVQEKLTPKKAVRKAAATDDETSAALMSLFGHNPSLSGTPILNFLTGQVDRIEPGNIPQVVVSNDFVKSALSGTGVMEFMTTEQPVQSLLDTLGISPNVASQLQELGGDLSKGVTPRELLDSMGVDSSRVLAELEILRDRLPIDGFQPYMARSAALRGQSQFMPDTARDAALTVTTADGTKIPVEDERRKAMNASLGGSIGTIAAPTPSILGRSAAASDVTKSASGPSLMQNSTGVAPAMPEFSMADSPSLASKPQSALTLVRDLRELPTIMKASIGAPVDGSLASAEILTMSGDQLAADADLAGGTLEKPVRIQEVSVDPFAALGREMGAAKIVGLPKEVITVPENTDLTGEISSFDLRRLYGEGVFSESPQRASTDFAANLRGDNLNAASLALAGLNLNTGKTENVVNSGQPQQMSIDSGDASQFLGQNAFSGDIASILGKSQAPNSIMGSAVKTDTGLSLSDWLESGRFAVASSSQSSDLLGGGADKESGSSGFESDRKLSGGADEIGNLFKDAVATRPQTSTSFAEKVATETAVMTPADRQQLLQKIADNAQMMIREGGSSIRMDLGTPELGKLDVAISLSQDRVDVRIMAASDQVRDLLNRELPKLRESLGIQNLNLGSVEVGVGGGQHNFSGSGGFNQNLSNNQGGMGNWDGSGFGRSFQSNLGSDDSRSIGRRIPTAMQRMSEMPRVAEGRIQVRV